MLSAVVPEALEAEILLGAQWRALPDGEEVQHQPCSPRTVQKGRWPGASLPLQLPDPGAMKGLFCCWGIAGPWKSQSQGNKAYNTLHYGCTSQCITPSTWSSKVTQNGNDCPPFFFLDFTIHPEICSSGMRQTSTTSQEIPCKPFDDFHLLFTYCKSLPLTNCTKGIRTFKATNLLITTAALYMP